MKSVKTREGRLVVSHCEVADTLWARMVGLLGRRSLAPGQALWIEPCNSVHTFFMRFAIDVVFLDASGLVLKIYEGMAPWRASWMHWRAHVALELAAGEAARAGINPGEVLVLCNAT